MKSKTLILAATFIAGSILSSCADKEEFLPQSLNTTHETTHETVVEQIVIHEDYDEVKAANEIYKQQIRTYEFEIQILQDKVDMMMKG